MLDVACMGILVADVITQTVDALPERGKLALMDSIRLYNGGGAMSSAINLSRLGARTAMLGKVGQDGFGQFLTGVLAQNGVDITGLVADPAVDTSASVALVDSGGERTFLHCPGSNGAYREEDIVYEAAAGAKILFLSGTTLLPSLDGAPTAVVLKKFRDMGLVTVLDIAWDDTGRWMELVGPALPHLDYFLPSIEEAEMLAGETDPDKIADFFFDCGVRHVVIKLGKRGCYFRESREADGHIIPAYTVDAVDTTGAGDAFCSGFLYGLSKGMSMEECCRLGNATGAFCVQAVGATSGMKDYDTVRKFMDEYPCAD